MTDLGVLLIAPEGWTLMTAVAVAVLGGTASVRAAKIARQATRDAAKSSPYEALAARVVQLEGRVEEQDGRIGELETELRTERERAAHAAAAFRTRIQVLLRFIASQDEFIEALLDLVRLHRIPMAGIPKKPELPSSAADEL